MKEKLSTSFSAALLLWISASTLFVTIVPTSIAVAAPVSALLGFAATVFAVLCKRYWLAAVGASMPLLVVAFLVVQRLTSAIDLQRAALPICIVLLVVQAFTTIVTLVEFRRLKIIGSGTEIKFSIQELLLATTVVAVAITISESFFASTDPVDFFSPLQLVFDHTLLTSTSFALTSLAAFSLRWDMVIRYLDVAFSSDPNVKRRIANWQMIVVVIGLVLLVVLGLFS